MPGTAARLAVVASARSGEIARAPRSSIAVGSLVRAGSLINQFETGPRLFNLSFGTEEQFGTQPVPGEPGMETAR